MSTRVLITGATGFIGRNVVERFLQDSNYHLICLLQEGDSKGLKILEDYKVEIIYKSNFQSYHNTIDVCIHLASYGVRYGDRDLDTMIDVNIKLSTQIMNFVAAHGCKYFFNAGSCFEYGEQDYCTPIKENSPLRPQDIYAASKVACEEMLTTLSHILDVKLVTFRLFGVFGKYESPSRLFPLIISSGINNSSIELTKGEQIRDYMDVLDVAEVLYRLIQKRKVINVNYLNICSGYAITVKEFVLMISDAFMFKKELFLFGSKEYRNNEAMYFVGDNKLLKDIIGEVDLSINEVKISMYKKLTHI